MYIFVPAPPPVDPVSTVIFVAVQAFSFLWSLFRGGVPSNVKSALEGLRDGQVSLGNALLSFASRIARTVGRLLQAVHGLWVRILEPALQRIERIALRVGRILDRVLKPYLDFLMKLRRLVFDLYERFFRPLIKTIETIRKITSILAILRVPFARQLDQRLARIQSQIMAPLVYVLQKLSEVGGFLNVILTARWILQRPLFTNSMHAYAGTMVNMWWNAQTTGPSAEMKARFEAPPEFPPIQQNVENMRASLSGTGPLAATTERGTRHVRALIGLAG